ncbi:response regulator [Cohnella hashimotonis]|uniref:Response regulator n=1 Tax=Cohnella hashimotonis TaxID=2826895 RepID=A0ABT6TBB0_9BACL|nr:response regulator [Cohnella hashimotonis]MDI4644054.1 response regulator [Cohnella hashimotonis]
MYKIVVVDDEPLLLRNIKNSIMQAHDGFAIVGEAADGDEALELIAAERPDVVFTDIKMPTMDGLTLIGELRRRGIDAKIVLLSGYQEFDYAKRALQFGVEDYLLKPLSPRALGDLLSKLHDVLEAEKRKRQDELLDDIVRKEIDFLPPAVELERMFRDYRAFGGLLLCAGSVSRFGGNWLTPAKDFWLKNDLSGLLGELVPEPLRFWIVQLNYANEKLVILASPGAPGPAFADIAGRLYDKLLACRFPVTMVARPPFSAMDDLPYLLQRDRILLQKFAIFGQSRRIDPHANEPSERTPDHPLAANAEKLLLNWIEKRQPDPFKAEFAALLGDCERQACPQIRLEGVLKRVVQLFQQTSPGPSQPRILEIELEIDELISGSYKYASLLEGMSVLLDELFQLAGAEKHVKEDQPALVLEMERYIRSRYTELLSLPSVAAHFGVTPALVSSLFKKHKGIPPMEFIIRLRIEKAKQLLCISPPLTIRDVAAAIGYDDPYYMSRLFKSVTGVSPSEYRETT